MVKVKLYGLARVKFDSKEESFDVLTVKELLEEMAKKFNVKPANLKEYLVYVNEVNITELKMYKTQLKDGDVVMLLSPSTGG